MQTLISGENTDWSILFEMFQNNRINPLSMLMGYQFLEVVKNACHEKYPYIAFADYFHTVRSMMLPELYLLTQQVPQADIYHATATGYSGILGSLGKWKYNKPFILTEHGIYTREREGDCCVPSGYCQACVSSGSICSIISPTVPIPMLIM